MIEGYSVQPGLRPFVDDKLFSLNFYSPLKRGLNTHLLDSKPISHGKQSWAYSRALESKSIPTLFFCPYI